MDKKSTTISELLSENSNLQAKNDQLHKELDETKENSTLLRIQNSTMKAELDQLENKSDWSTVESFQRPKPKTPKLLLIGTSNTKKIDTGKISSKFETVKEIAMTIGEAEKVIDKSTIEPDVIAYHVLSNELKFSSSTEVVSKLEKLLQKTKECKPNSKIIVSLATNRSDNKKNNLKVNTINSIIKEIGDGSSDFTICDHSNLSHGNEIKPNLLAKDKDGHSDGVHLSDDGVNLLASNIRKAVDKVLNIRTFSPHRRPPNRHRQWQNRQQNQSK